MNNEYQTVGLYDHNIRSYKIIKEAFMNNEKVVGIVHATGTGKSYNALQLAYDNKDKHIIYVVPSSGIIEHIEKIIEDNPNLDLKRDFPSLEFRTYQSFVNLNKEEIANLTCDLLVLDEFHHIGAPIWGARINTFLEMHQNLKVFGMTAYTVRDRGTIYERDMANPDTNELFSRNIFSRYDLCDAMIDGVLPKPIYFSAYTLLEKTADTLEQRLQKLNPESAEYKENMSLLKDIRKRINEAPSIPSILKKHLKPQGKYIYFCPPNSEEGTNDIETIKKQALEWLKPFISESDIVFYTSTSAMGDLGRKNRDAFYNDTDLEGNDVSNKFQIMFAINQYNEGIHAPNIDGVIMGRGTTSDIVYFEQLGRALAVRGNTKEEIERLEKCSLEELITMCKKSEIKISENPTKEELIEKLTAPIIIDLTNNFEFIKELENNLQERIKEIQTHGLGEHRKIKIKDATFDIEIVNQDLFEILRYISDRLTRDWNDYYELAKKYYEYHGDLEVPAKFKTTDGYTYDENGLVNLGKWIYKQRQKTPEASERGILLCKIGMRFQNKISTRPWEEIYEYARIYYEHHGDLEVPQKFKTSDGYTYDENGTINLGKWINTQRNRTLETSERGILLNKIGMRFQTNKRNNRSWKEMYEFAREYYEHYGNLEIPQKFKTSDGFTYDENGTINLGKWLKKQKFNTSEMSEKGILLSKIGMRFQTNKKNTYSWEEMYEYVKKYYEHYGNLEIPQNFKTDDGFTYKEDGKVNLGMWIINQRRYTPEMSARGILLSKIGMRFQIKKISTRSWEEMYGYAKKYYEYYGNLEIPQNFKTSDGYTYDENGAINLGKWIHNQRRLTPMANEKGILLSKIGMRFQTNKISTYTWEEMYEYAKKYYEHYGNLEIPQNFKTSDGYTYDENGAINLGKWIHNQRQNKNLSDERRNLLTHIGMIWNVKNNKEEIIIICQNNNIDYEKNKEILNHLSIEELLVKIEFLRENNIALTDEFGLLNDIFSTSSKDLEEKYGYSLADLINKYYIKDKGR